MRLRRLRHPWRRIRDGSYWLTCWAWHRFNVIRISTLGPTWHDRDDVLLHAAFQILTDFVDLEHPFDHFDVANSHNRAEWEEILRLYAWWTVERPARKYGVNAVPEGTPYRNEKLCALDDEYEAEDQRNLESLVKNRGILWT